MRASTEASRWLLSLLLGSVTAHAQQVPAGYEAIAREYGLPPVLLYAVALTESGQRLRNGEWRPWPWSLNIDGTGSYYPSRYAAWQVLQRTLEGGAVPVDIGLMQVSWRYHQPALGSAWQALDPYHNLRVAAAILARSLQDRGNWRQAAGCYHAPYDAARATHYSGRVESHWARLINESRADQ